MVQQDYSGKVFGHKIFTQLLFIEGNFNPTEINDIDVSTLATRILRRSGKQVIDGVYTFIGDVTASMCNVNCRLCASILGYFFL